MDKETYNALKTIMKKIHKLNYYSPNSKEVNMWTKQNEKRIKLINNWIDEAEKDIE